MSLNNDGLRHTPGPWVALPPSYPSSPYGVFYRDSRGHVIATTARAEDAALIAAAPTMAKALQLAEIVLSEHVQYDNDPASAEYVALEAVREAIAKANATVQS